jgi:hypothetical protein
VALDQYSSLLDGPSGFRLDTSCGNHMAWDVNDTGFADSSGFKLEKSDDSFFGDSIFSDSAGSMGANAWLGNTKERIIFWGTIKFIVSFSALVLIE